jgi:Ca2+-binding RTX toxin-like protein
MGIAMASFVGTSGDNNFTGTSGVDTFDMTQGGNDEVKAGGGDDTITFGATLTAADSIKGGAGFDILGISGDYSAGLTLDNGTLNGIERLELGAGNDYKIILADGNLAAGKVMDVVAFSLGAGDSAYIDGSAETDGLLYLGGGAGDDTLIGGAGNDAFDSGTVDGGEDTMIGGGGSDGFYFGSDFDPGDHVDGGIGNDINTVFLNGDYSGGFTLGVSTIVNLSEIHLGNGWSYDITLVDANVGAGQLFYVNGENLTAGHTAVVDGSQETDGNLYLLGGGGKDSLTGGALADTIEGNGAADKLTGGAGADTFIYLGVSDSRNTKYDHVLQFDAAADKFALWFTVTGVDAAVAGGTLSKATFNSDLAASIDIDHLLANHAVLFMPRSGDLADKLFLIVDANGTDGYQAGADLVINVTGMTHAASFDVSDFV